jgi:mitochondrial fission protein ELM1
MSYRAGESSQIYALGEALGWPHEIKRLTYRKSGFALNLTRGVGLNGIKVQKSSPLEPPWPDLVISAGLRNEPVCRWIRQQAPNPVRLVQIGRTWADLGHFDLVVTTPQYRLPERDNVLHNQTTLHRVTAERLQQAAALWEPRLTHLPRPYVTVVIGGNSGPYTFGPRTAQALGAQTSAMAEAIGGSLLVTTSSRTPRAMINTLAASVTAPLELYRWAPGAIENPYYGFLALADSIVVTGDSVAMLSEACATCKPVFIYDLDRQAMGPWWKGGQGMRISAALYRGLMHWGPQRLSRDLALFHQPLIDAGRAAWFGDPFPDKQPPPLPDLDRTVRRIQNLFR